MKKVRIQEQGGGLGSGTMNPNIQQNPPGEYPSVLDDITFAENRARRPRPRHSQSEEGPFPSTEERRYHSASNAYGSHSTQSSANQSGTFVHPVGPYPSPRVRKT